MKLKFNKTYIALAHTLFLIELAIAFIIKTGFIRYTFGDYLVVILLYTIIRGCTNLKMWVSALVVIIIAYSVEFLQGTPFLSYFNLENSFTAKLVFGSTFQTTDLLAYTLGMLTVIWAETAIAKFKNTKNTAIWKL